MTNDSRKITIPLSNWKCPTCGGRAAHVDARSLGDVAIVVHTCEAGHKTETGVAPKEKIGGHA